MTTAKSRTTTLQWADIGVGDDVIQFELFDATHMGIDYRYPLSLAWLSQRIAE